MLNGHHKTYNIHALKSLLKPVDQPVAQLGVGDGETLSSIDNLIRYPRNLIKPVLEPEIATSSYEYTQIDGFSDPIDRSHFPNTAVIGNALEGWGY